MAQELSPAEDPGDPEEVKPENIPELRNVGISSSVLLHRVVESLEFGRLCRRRDELQLQVEAAEDPDTHDRAEEELQRVLDRIKVLKGYIKSSDQNKPARLSEANRNKQVLPPIFGTTKLSNLEFIREWPRSKKDVEPRSLG